MTACAFLSAFGLEVASEFPLPGVVKAASPPSSGGRHLVLRRVDVEELPAPDGEPRVLRNLQVYDGAPYAMLEAGGGDILFLYGRFTAFHLSADHGLLLCAFPEGGDRSWERVLLDTVLWGIALLRGAELLHASAVLHDGRLIVFAAGMGGGKSSLACEYLRRGAVLFADDVVALEAAGKTITAFPGPPLMNLPNAVDPATVAPVTVLADFAEERWVELAREPLAPTTPAAVVIVDRFDGGSAQCEPIAVTSLDLLTHAVVLPGLGAMRSRFELFTTLAETVSVLHLTADPAVPPDELAHLIEGALG